MMSTTRLTLYLHVGPHKTGSTYMQMEFVNQEQSLQDQGIVYPRIGREAFLGHHNVAWFYKGRPLINTTVDQISANLLSLAKEGHEKLLMSSEEFMRLSETDLAELRRCFEEYDFHVLYFRRTGNSLVVSLWQELVKHGLTIPLDELSPDIVKDHFHHNPFAHEENTSTFKNGLGGRATTFDYDELRGQGADVLDAVCDVLGVKLNSSARSVNPRTSIDVIELIRAANLHIKSLGYTPGSHPREFTLSMLRSESGLALKKYVKEKLAAVSAHLPLRHFVQTGFPSSDVVDETSSQDFSYVPGMLLLDELNKDNPAPWQTLKEWIITGERPNRQQSLND